LEASIAPCACPHPQPPFFNSPPRTSQNKTIKTNPKKAQKRQLKKDNKIIENFPVKES
jgi:hypothetical protein